MNPFPARGLLAHSRRDRVVLAAGLGHGGLVWLALSLAASSGMLVRVSTAVVLAVAMAWGANTVSHIHLHTPLFTRPWLNRAFGLYLTVLLAVPQTWWKLRHLEHHGLRAKGRRWRALGLGGLFEMFAAASALLVLARVAPSLCFTTYLPGLAMGFGLCALQGRQEHARHSDGVDHHGALYNRAWFNDGFHAAHHRVPQAHWAQLPGHARASDVTSRWAPLLRWNETLARWGNAFAAGALDRLERAVLRWPAMRSLLLFTHRRAWRDLLATLDASRINEVTIVGGGLFPRTALILSAALPHARLTLLDAQPHHLEQARAFLPRGANVQLQAGRFEPSVARPCDLLVVPLAYRGDRECLYAQPPAPLLVIHDWLWRARGQGGAAVPLLLKRLNLVAAAASEESFTAAA